MSNRRRKTKPGKPNLKTKTVSNPKPTATTSTHPPVLPRYVSEIRGIMDLLMRNKGSEPFKTVPNLPQYKTMFPNAICLQGMNQKSVRDPCGYASFKQFDTDFKTLIRQEIRYDNKVHSAPSARRKQKMEILRGYFDTLSQPYLQYGPNLSPNSPKKKRAASLPQKPTMNARRMDTPAKPPVVSPLPTMTMRKKEAVNLPPPSTKKSIRKQPGSVIDLSEDPIETPAPPRATVTTTTTTRTTSTTTISRKKSQTTGRKRLHFDSPTGDERKTGEGENEEEGAPKKKKIRLMNRKESAATSDDDVVIVSSTKKKKKAANGNGRASSLDPLSTPVSRAGFSFDNSSAGTASKKRKKDTPRYGETSGHSHLFGTDGRPPVFEDVKNEDDDSKDDGTVFTESISSTTMSTPRGGISLGSRRDDFDSTLTTPPSWMTRRRRDTYLSKLDGDGDVKIFTNTPTRTHEDVLHMLQWKRFELTVDVLDEQTNEWKRRVVLRDGFEMQSVVRKFFDVQANMTMRVALVRFLHNISYDDDDVEVN